VSAEGAGSSVAIHTISMELAGDVLQDVAAALGLKEVETVADFPEEMEVS